MADSSRSTPLLSHACVPSAEHKPMVTNDDDPFREMEQAWLLSRSEEKEEEKEEESEVVYLPDGDIHVCRGVRCEFLELNADKCFVCTKSGVCFGTQAVREDYSTGRQAGSSNPDDHAGEPVGGSWKPKKDLKALSNAAYNASNQVCDKEEVAENAGRLPKQNKGPGVGIKRGARCVDEPDVAQKRARAARRCGNDLEQLHAMQKDAESTLCKLVSFDRKPETKSKARDARNNDPLTQFRTTVKKYVKDCLASGIVPTLDSVHNIAIATAHMAECQRRKAALSDKNSLLLKVRMREMVSVLVCSLWQASCATPYMGGARRGADSFRPFVCGMLYSLKRGVSLQDGTVVVPCCPLLAESLPALRGTATNSVAKALHASSHRGLCTLHRSINSCTIAQALELYDNCILLAQQLQNSVESGNFDLC